MLAVLVAIGAFTATGCGVQSSPPAAVSALPQPTAAAEQPTNAPPATPDDAPRPRHVDFAPGETINTDRQAGVVFVDPATGLAEGWLLAGMPQDYAFSLGASDGHLLLYHCQHPGGSSSPCDSANAWYLFDTRTDKRVRFDSFIDYMPPAIVWPDGGEVLGSTVDRAVLVSSEDAHQSRSIDVPQGYQLAPWSALWNSDGTELLVSAFHTGTPHCVSPPVGPSVVCSGGPVVWKTLLIDRSSGRVSEFGDNSTPAFAWSPDGSMFALLRASEQRPGSSELAVYSQDGKLKWIQTRYSIFANLNWSPDGSTIALQVLSKPERIAGSMRLDVLDAATGAMRYRIPGAIACEGRVWTADSSRLILFRAYGFDRSVVADALDGSLRLLPDYVSPSPTQSDTAYAGGFAGWATAVDAVNIDNGDTHQLASFSSPMESPSYAGSPMFGGRFAFIATTSGGRGGCAEGIEDQSPPVTHFEYPPFTD